MKTTKTLIAALGIALLGVGAAQADEVAKTRAEVRAETVYAAQHGDLNDFSEGATNVDPLARTVVGKSRAQVVNETLAARASGELFQYGEHDQAAVDDQFVSTKSRAEVRAQAIDALRHGGLSQGQWTQG